MNITEKKTKVHTIFKSNYGRYNRFFMTVVNLDKFGFFLLAENRYVLQSSVFCTSLG